MPVAYEEMLAFVLARLHEPIDQHEDAEGAVVITSGDPGEVIVRLTESEVTIAEYSVWENGSARSALRPITVGTVGWTALSADATMRAVTALIHLAREARTATFRVCSVCARATPPERMQSDDRCRECAETTATWVF